MKKEPSMKVKRLLPPNVLLTGIIGLSVTFILAFTHGLPLPWATSFGIVFLIMIIGSYWSMDIFSRKKI